MKIDSTFIIEKVSLYATVLFTLLSFTQCSGQQADKLVPEEKPKAKIVSFQPVGGPYYVEYTFYDTAGNKIKTMRHDEFESRNPVFKLDLPKAPDSMKGILYFDYLVDYSRQEKKTIPKRNAKKIVSELSGLKKYGLTVKNPEKATIITGLIDEKTPFITQPGGKYVTKVESASVLDAYAAETQDTSNALLDCSYISVYNFTGEFIKGILIPDKVVDYAIVSDDGKYMACICSYSLVWDEGLDSKPEGVYIVDLVTNKKTYITTPETHGSIFFNSILFADHYFQMSYGNPYSGSKVDRLFINPYNKTYFLKNYLAEYKTPRKAIRKATSFIQFEGMKERIEDFRAYAY
jgi:hypothetical protein